MTIKRVLLLALFVAVPVWGASYCIATIADSTVGMVFADGYIVTDPGGNNVNIQCAPIVRDSVGVIDTLEFRLRIIGMDTSQVKIFAVTDTIPTNWPGEYKLTPTGKLIAQ